MNATIETRSTRTFKQLLAVALVATGLVASAGCSLDVPTGEPVAEPAPAPASPDTPKSAPAPAANPAGSGETVSTKIDNETGGKATLSDGTEIEIPAGALPPGVDTITVTSAKDPAPAEYESVSPAYEFGPAGTVFLKPLKVTLPFAAKTGMDTATLTMMWSRHNAEGFDMIPSTFTPAASGIATVSGEGTHFSRIFCGRRYTTDPFPPKDPYSK